MYTFIWEYFQHVELVLITYDNNYHGDDDYGDMMKMQWRSAHHRESELLKNAYSTETICYNFPRFEFMRFQSGTVNCLEVGLNDTLKCYFDIGNVLVLLRCIPKIFLETKKQSFLGRTKHSTAAPKTENSWNTYISNQLHIDGRTGPPLWGHECILHHNCCVHINQAEGGHKSRVIDAIQIALSLVNTNHLSSEG